MVTYAGSDLHSEKFWGRSQDLKFKGYPGCSQNFKFLFVTVTNITILGPEVSSGFKCSYEQNTFNTLAFPR